MMSIVVLFWMYVILFAVIGGMRGWAKELLVSFSVLLALAVNHVLKTYIPIIRDLPENDLNLFWLRVLILGVLVYFGYQTVVSIQHLANRAVRERFQDTFVGVLVGALNGYLIAGSMLYYMHVANYPFSRFISPPTDPALANTVAQMMMRMPPELLGVPGIYFAIILAFVFVIIVYV